MGARLGYGPERIKHSYNVKGVLTHGGVAAMGTDWPVASVDPWLALETLITRQNPWDEVEGTFGDPIELEQVLRIATINGAVSSELMDGLHVSSSPLMTSAPRSVMVGFNE